MRVSDLLMSKSYLNDISSMRGKIDKLSNQIANQSTILKPSDSPQGTAKILKLNKQISSTDIYLRNIKNSLGFVDETIRGMEKIESDVSNVLVKLTEVNNATNKENYANFAQQIDQILDNIIDSANISYDGKYIFGGTDFEDKPYANDGTQVTLNVTDVSGESNLKIAPNNTQKINISGNELFGAINASPTNPGLDIFNTLIKIRDDLNAGNLPLSEDVQSVADFHKHLLNKMTDAGFIYNNLEQTQSLLENQRLETEALISEEKDLDMAKAIIDMQNYDYILQTSYKLSSMILPKSLMDFI